MEPLELPRVTAILDAALGPYQMPATMSEADRTWYKDRGSAIHAATALDDAGELDPATVDPRIMAYVEAWRSARKALRMEIIEAELSVRHETAGYRGTLDRVVRLPDLAGRRLVVLDIKTSEAKPRVKLQTMAYALAYKRSERLRTLPRRTCVVLEADGRWTIGLGTEAIFGDDARDRAAWLACLGLAPWRKGREDV
jgi:hypothetical protein